MQQGLKEKALQDWVSRFTSELLSWAFYKVSDSELAKDLVQDTFLAASEKFETFREESSPKTWLFSILNYKIIDHYRQKVRQPKNYDQQSLSEYFAEDGEWLSRKKPSGWDENELHLLDNEDFNLILKACIEELPEKWSLSIRLKYLMNKKGEDICQELNITPTNFWQIMHRAKLQLRECIETNWLNN